MKRFIELAFCGSSGGMAALAVMALSNPALVANGSLLFLKLLFTIMLTTGVTLLIMKETKNAE
jgi:hypothetical protein